MDLFRSWSDRDRESEPFFMMMKEAEGAAAAAEPRQHAHRLLPWGLHKSVVYSNRAVNELSRMFSQY